MKSNFFNTKQLELDNEEYKKNISDNRITNKENGTKLNEVLDKINTAKEKKEDLLGKRYSIDDEIKKVNPDTLKKEIEGLTIKGVTLKNTLDGINDQIKVIPKFSYDEDVHEEYRTDEKTLLVEKNDIESTIKTIGKLIKDLKEGEICHTCKRALDEVDHSSEIKENEKLLKVKEKEVKWALKPMNFCLNLFGNGEVEITKQGSIKIGNITIQRKGGDGGRKTAQMLQFKINPCLVFHH